MIRVNIPSRRGHDPQQLELLDGRKMISNHLQKGWIASINGRAIPDVNNIQNGDVVNLHPGIMGG